MAAAAEARKDWATARMHLTSWLEQEPKNGQARQRLARSLFLIGSPDDALVELDKAVKDEPSLEAPAVSMGRLWALKGDAKKAGEWFEKAAQKEPESARVHQAYGEWLLEQGRIDEAKIHADAAARLDPKAKETDRLRGLIARHSRDYATAEKIFDGLLRDAPADFFASNQLALVLAEQKEEDKKRKAVQLAEVNARQYQKNADALATLGWVYWRNDRAEEAEKALSLAVSGGQATSDTAFYLATVLDKRGKKDDLQKLLQSAVDTTGPFIYRKEATAWLDELKKTAKPK
jgi:Tfp pilus assembly protein PilF